jgi:hypothetical protein
VIAASKKNCGRGVETRPHDYVSASPDELRTDLPDARVASIGDVSETSAADIPARIRELRVVENIEEFTPNLEHLGFGDRDRLLKPEIGVVEAGAMEESPISGAEGATVRAWGGPSEKAVGRDKCALVKICERARGIARVAGVNRSHEIRHIGGRTASKGAV